ncbi:MAG: hypothetical protein JW801_04395 [Bacteroidales bacterium]|nr:hypothetical protein [Bacteroidales bacterium]
MKNKLVSGLLLMTLMMACQMPAKKKTEIPQKHNYIVLLDLSDRLIVQDDQPVRDKEIIRYLYKQFEEKVRKEFYIKSRDEISVVIAPQSYPRISRERYEELLRVNIGAIKDLQKRRSEEAQRRNTFSLALDELYSEAASHNKPEDYSGADIYKFFNEDLQTLYDPDPMTTNFLFILTDGYYWVKSKDTLMDPGERFSNLQVALVEVSPWDKDEEWDRLQGVWEEWFDLMNIPEQNRRFIKRKAISVEKEEIGEMIGK